MQGTKVSTVIGNIEGIITAVCIRGNIITYELSYFNQGKHESHWLSAVEIIASLDYERLRVGFK